ncbi:hypothetical protein LQR31_07080 [Chromobacterium vaccinii]|uniref:hypothetical protein n=1 Tax=Chromobacterium vaccinii TaxID=1108595 RepID=UPI001E5251C5|nr:hypothetical protein [Chromobacterium vaccinii]MCD4484237.1 hypothetical protein [Chromobacterium vaccinii]MCD4499996.1 hypothetical protein [Chromobacterium vaccinii]
MHFDEIQSKHFVTLSRTPLPHTLIEQALVAMGGGGNDGMNFRKQALAAAGWSHDGLVPFAKHPDKAAEAFNRLREAMAGAESPDALLKALGAE